MTSLFGQLPHYFCKPIKIAVMTFDHEYFVEFCFDKFENTEAGRMKAGEAISYIPYIRKGQENETRWTHTAGAARCACDYMLTPTCGLPPAADCIDVVFITDGQANNPSHDICTDIRCLHNRRGVNTYVIGIGNPQELQLGCMVEHNLLDLFNFPTFMELEVKLKSLLNVLKPPIEPTYSCN